MIERFVLLAFGGIFIASWFILFSFVRMARVEAHEAHGQGLFRNRGFLLAASLVVGAIGLIGICGLRAADGLSGREISGSSPLALVVSLTMLWVAWTGFHWSATFDRAKWHWICYLALSLAWLVLIFWPSLWPILR